MENATNACADMATSTALKAPRWNMVASIGPASSTRATVAGTPIRKVNRMAQSSRWENSWGESLVCFCDRLGKITVAKAMPNTPKGNSSNRSE